MQRDPEQPGLPVATLENYRYQHGFWARDLQGELGCAGPTRVPFMSGFGGITVVTFPNGTAWYSVADDGLLASIDFATRSEEHTSELQSLLRHPHAHFCLNKNNT